MGFHHHLQVNLALTVSDVSAPVNLALPPYGGMWYIVFAFGMAAIWVFSLGPFLFCGIPLIWVSHGVPGSPPPSGGVINFVFCPPNR